MPDLPADIKYCYFLLSALPSWRMNVSLSPELEKFIDRKVATGTYHTASEVVREALRLLMRQEERRGVELERLRAEIAAGLDQVASARPLDVRQIKAAGRKRLAARRMKRVG
jgi:antitoxin ParD1/3/4